MNETLRETAKHGDRDFPFALYHMHRYFQPCAFALHWHDEVEIIYVQQGLLNLTIDKMEYLGKAGDIFVVNSRVIHQMSVTVTPTVYVTALFPLESMLFQVEDSVMAAYLRPLMEGQLRFPTSVPNTVPQIQEKMERIISLFHEAPEYYQLLIRVSLLDLLCEFFTHHLMEKPEEETRYKEKHREILAYIQANYLREITLDSISEAFHMVPKYFSRYFKNTFHISLTEYINRLRLENAADLLRHTDMSITEIALRTGFNSSSYFNKRFREEFHKTPREYRALK